ncbi:hypothetical protein B0J13DRAFT_674322 [Dactylonectria estremocensis]|uniref:Peptidase S8/S53 domain-containing protein n=1 Tax=Dactylonectria estremocensis TaxID=1079267 RepID=A0A9P9EZ11_9HYPO|nr:hypothetical protein B0J13DRAFT_674322 [Dactylonectria estremocensis]
MASIRRSNTATEDILPTESPGWNGLQTLRSCLSGRLARFRPQGVPRSRPRKSNNDAIIFELDLSDVLRAKPIVVRLSKEDYDEMNEMALDLLYSLNSMVNLDLQKDPSFMGITEYDGQSLGQSSTGGYDAAILDKDFKQLHTLMGFFASLEASPSPIAAQIRFNLTTGSSPLFILPPKDAGTLAIGRVRKWKAFLDGLPDGDETVENLQTMSLDATQLLVEEDQESISEQIEKRASVMVDTIFKEFRQLGCSKEATHEIRLQVSDELYTGTCTNLNIFVSCCPDESLVWQEAECGSFPGMSDVAKVSICNAIRQAMERRRRLHLLVKPQGLFDVTDKTRAVLLPSDNFDGESLSELFRQGIFRRIEPQDYIDGTAKKKIDSRAKTQIALGLSRCLMDFFDEGLDLASYSWTPDNVHFRQASVSGDKQSSRHLYVSLRPNISSNSTLDLSKMFKNGNPVLLSFARLLLEILGGRDIPIEIHPNNEDNISNWLSLCNIVDKLDPNESCSGYLRVVKGCLDLWKRLQSFQNRSNDLAARKVVREAIYEEVVKKLELILNPQPLKRKRRRSTVEYPPGKKLHASMAGPLPGETILVEKEAKPRVSFEGLEDLEDEYGGLSLYDEQDEEQTSNRGKAKEYFKHLDAVTMKYIKPLMKSSTCRLPQKQRGPIKIAIIDSGIDMTHPFIDGKKAQIRGWRNWTDADPNNYHDTYGHGTQVARLVLKVAPAVEVYVAKVSTGKQISQKDTGRIAEAIEWATAVWKVDMISLSLGLDGEDEKVKRALDKVLNPQRGGSKKIVMAAAANWGGNHAIAFPGCYEGVICIHSTDGHGNPSPSNPTVRNGINFAVLGLSIETSVKVKAKKCAISSATSPAEPRREVAYISGTSYATAIAAGIAANVLEFARHNPSLSEGEREVLYSSWGMRLLFEEMGTVRREHYYILPWKMFDGRAKEDIWRGIQDILRGQRWRGY